MDKSQLAKIQREVNNVKWALERHHQGMRMRWPWRSVAGAFEDWNAERVLDEVYGREFEDDTQD